MQSPSVSTERFHFRLRIFVFVGEELQKKEETAPEHGLPVRFQTPRVRWGVFHCWAYSTITRKNLWPPGLTGCVELIMSPVPCCASPSSVQD